MVMYLERNIILSRAISLLIITRPIFEEHAIKGLPRSGANYEIIFVMGIVGLNLIRRPIIPFRQYSIAFTPFLLLYLQLIMCEGYDHGCK